MAGAQLDDPVHHRPRGRLDYIDGLRGLAVGSVMIFHAATWARWPAGEAARLLSFGHLGVDLFFLISGFCMMWPLVGVGGRVAPLDGKEFIKRRLLRIGPPYWVAIVLVAASSWIMWQVGGASWWNGQPMQSMYPRPASEVAGDVVAHASFLHGFIPHFDRSIDGAFWSLAVEWQFYLLLPLLVLLARRWGVDAAAVVTVIIPMLYLGFCYAFFRDFPRTAVGGDLILLRLVEFGVGMWIAHHVARGGGAPRWALLAVVAAAAAVEYVRPGGPYTVFAWAVAFGGLIIAASRPGWIFRLMTGRALRWLGRVSYSAYLVHGAAYMLLAVPLTRWEASLPVRAATLLLLGPTLALVAAATLHRFVEVPAQRWSHNVCSIRPPN